MISEEWRRKEGRTPAVVALHPPKAASDIALNKLDFSQTEGPLQEDGHGGVCVRDAAWRRAVGIQTPPERSWPSTSSPGAWGETIGYYYDDEDSSLNNSVFSTRWQRPDDADEYPYPYCSFIIAASPICLIGLFIY